MHPYPSVGKIYSDMAAKYGHDYGEAELDAHFKKVWLNRDGLTGLVGHSTEKIERNWWYSLVKEVFDAVGGINNFEEFFQELYDLFARPDVWRLYPGTLDVLEELKKRGKKLAVISNWDSRLFQLCEGLGLTPYFDFILASAVFGASKPDVKIFNEALNRSGLPAEACVHIGDSLEDDIHGAKGAGIKAILINRHSERHDMHGDKLKNIPVIHDLKELLS